ncbi:MAG: Uma2 family endonuclease [Pyrinomonadaceae bacterium]
MSATHKLVTAEELFAMPEDGYRYELVKGELRRKPLNGAEHGIVCANVIVKLGGHIKFHGQGIGFGTGTGFQLASGPDTVLAPDGAFVQRERSSQSGIPETYWPGAPDLAIEVIGPEDIFEEVEEKIDDWLVAGARAVWVINSKRRGVTVYHSMSDVTRLSEEDELEGGDVVPGFRCRVSEIFV